MHPLDAWLKARKKTRLWLAEEIGTTEATISRIVNGKQWPKRELAESIVRITRGAVTANDFLEVA
jgi:DNA-binding XRE family transcriptional regulator